MSDTAIDTAARVIRRTQSATEVASAALERIARLDDRLHAFECVLTDAALQAARQLDSGSIARLPLAGVPIAVKDNLPVAGAPMRGGSRAGPATPCAQDHPVVERLRAAGAVIVGKTRMPELGIWATTDNGDGITRNPWDPGRTSGGSSGGSAVAVAAGMVSCAIGNDGLGSLRIPAACCGVFTIKPGLGLVPSEIGRNDWYGFTENGPIASTVRDAALLLSVMSAGATPAAPDPPARRLRVAVSTRAPMAGLSVDPEHVHATLESAAVMNRAGHTVEPADPPYSAFWGGVVLMHWAAGAAGDADGLSLDWLETRTQSHVRAGRLVRSLGLLRPPWRTRWQRRVEPLFARYDVLVTPTLAQPPLRAGPWSERSWLSNVVSNLRFAPFCASWNLAGYPAVSIPAGMHSLGLPIGVQLVGPPGSEAVLLGLSALLEQERPWPRHPQATF